MMTNTIITGIFNVVFENLNEIFILNKWLLVKGGESFDNVFTNLYFKTSIGELSYNTLKENPFFFSYFSEEVNEQDVAKKYSAVSESASMELEALVGCLWFIKDNSVNLSSTYVYSEEKGYCLSRTRYNHYCTANGNYEDTIFSLDDLQKATSYFSKIIENTGRPKEVVNENSVINLGHQVSAFNSQDYNTNHRVDRAWNFLTLARTNSFLPLKISFYMAIFECLFTTNAELVSHKIAERSSKYLGGTLKEQREVFDTIKDAYTFRSKFSHGQSLGERSKIQYQKDTCKKVDI